MTDTYLIWSNEHNAWWGPREAGYVTQVLCAGVYTRERAEQIERRSAPDEVAVPLSEAIDRYRRWHATTAGTVLEAIGLAEAEAVAQ